MMARGAVCAATAVAVALLAGGCGKESEPAAQGSADRLRAIEITAPEHQQEYEASREAKSLTRAVDVGGTAAAGRAIRVVARCQVGRCSAEVRADDEGRWAAPLTITVSTFQPSVKISAAYAEDPAAGEPATVEITLREPETASKEQPKTTTQDDEPSDATGGSGSPPRDPKPTAPASSTDRPAGGAPAGGPRPSTRLTMIGDSLAEGTEPYLQSLLPAWTVTTNARRGRPLAEGMAQLRAASLGAGPHVLALSLFTNDGPRSVVPLDAAVRETARRAGSGGCAIWATIVRPPVGGVSYEAANTRLRELGATVDGVRIVDWAAAVQRNPEWLAGDGVHATPEGYRARARLYAEEAQACAG